MPETFAPFTWIDGPGGSTPITAAQLNRLEAGLESVDDRAAALELGALTPVAVTYAASLTINATLGSLFRVTATGNLTLVDITGGTNGQLISLEVRASGGDRTFTVAGETVTIPSGQRWWGDFRYDSVPDEWMLRVGDAGGSGPIADGSLALAKLDTTGTASSATFLRGDGVWTDLADAESSRPLYERGINLAGGEFAHTAATLPGVYGDDYSYDSAATLAAVADRGHTLIRLPFRWERIQPTRGAALNATELGRLQTFVANARAEGMRVILDVHNYARYIDSSAAGGLERVLGTANLPVSSLVDLWTRLSTAFKNDPDVDYDLMNEPHDLVAVPGGFTGTTRYDWSDGVQGWTGDTATASVVSGRLRLAGTATNGFFQFRKDDSGTKRGGTLTGTTLEAVVTLGAGITGNWRALLQWQNTSFAWQSAAATTYTRVDTGATVTGLIAGVAVRVRATHTAIATPNAFAIQVEANDATAGAVSADIDDFAQGSVTGGMTAAQVWEDAVTQVCDAIRANGDTNHIRIPTYNYSSAKNVATNHPAGPWWTDPANNCSYQVHYYFDVDNSGDYPDSYTAENAAAISAGYASLAARAVAEIGNATTWADDHNVKLFVGEIGWTNTADTASWNAVGEAIYDHLDAHQVDVTYWAGGARWGSGYNLSLYTGENQETVKAQATVVEAHPTVYRDLSGQVADLDSRVTVLESVSGGAAQAAPYVGPAFMVIDAETPSELETARTNGATHALVQVKWDQHQSTLNGAVDATTVLERIDDAVAAGLRVCLRVSPQYIPSFVDSGGVKFKRSNGTEHNPGNVSGYNVRDWVWSKSTRSMVEDFLGKLFIQLDWSKIERVQVGGGPAGELQYPLSDFASTPNVPYWWGYSTPAQSGGSDLAPRMSACPVPGHVPSTGTTWTDNDEKFVGWYTQSLNNWMIWLIEQHRRFFTGPIWVMHPGFGLRRNSMTPTGSNALQYRMQVASGLDWASQIGAYPDADCHPYSTWCDGTHPWDPAPYSDVNDGNGAAWYHLLRVSRSLGRAGRIWGENTAINSGNDVMNRVFTQHAVAHGYEGVTWLNHDGLADGSTDTYANFAARIAEVTTAQIDHQPAGTGGSSGSGGSSGAGAVASVNGQTGIVVLDADDLADGTTNHVFTADDDTKLAGISPGATANATNAQLRDRSTHTGTQSADTLTDGTTNRLFSAAEKTKLAGIATAATSNSTDVQLRDRSTHTGTQPVTSLATTGTRSSSTVLHGDDVWRAPSGGTSVTLDGSPATTLDIDTSAITGADLGLDPAADQGFLAWTYDIAASSGATAPTAGSVYLCRLRIPTAASVTALAMSVSASGVGLSNTFVGLFNSAGGRVGVSADQSTTFQSTGVKIVSLAAPATVTAGLYYVGILVGAGTTIPTFLRGISSASVNANLGAPNFRYATSGTGLTAMPASIDLAASTAAATALWTAVRV